MANNRMYNGVAKIHAEVRAEMTRMLESRIDEQLAEMSRRSRERTYDSAFAVKPSSAQLTCEHTYIRTSRYFERCWKCDTGRMSRNWISDMMARHRPPPRIAVEGDL